MNKCSICGEERKSIKFKYGFVCEKCLEYIRNAKINTDISDRSDRRSRYTNRKRSNEVVSGSEKAKN